jgi:ABC-2 type transport system ATP-binding protein
MRSLTSLALGGAFRNLRGRDPAKELQGWIHAFSKGTTQCQTGLLAFSLRSVNRATPPANGLSGTFSISRPRKPCTDPATGAPHSPAVIIARLFQRKSAPMESIVSIDNLEKQYAGGFQALKGVSLEIRKGEILALLGPNGAGKTTLISIICGIVNPSSGAVTVGGHDIIKDFRKTRSLIGLVPQELTTDAFESVWSTVTFSRGLYGKPPNPAYIEQVLRDLSLWEKKDSMMMMLSGGMKRRVLIAKALSHEPSVLFLDEPTAGVDVELRKDMWRLVSKLRESGVTIILTTHYIEEAEEIADRVGVINHGELVLVEDKAVLMAKLGKRQLTLDLDRPIDTLPVSLQAHSLELTSDGTQLIYTYNSRDNSTITSLLEDLRHAQITVHDLHTKETSLEEIFVELVKANR